MFRTLIYVFLCVLMLQSCATSTKSFETSEIALIPKPNTFQLQESSFQFTKNTTISIENKVQEKAATYLVNLFDLAANFNFKINTNNNRASIHFIEEKSLAPEAYQLIVTPKKITIKASNYAGYLYGIQTIRQLLPISIEKNTGETSKWLIPCVTIKDAPRFVWRAFMLDEARYFHGEKFVKQLLDQMALLKMNIFHWHLTDDSGWRIEIKKYPLLTEIGSIRTNSEIETWGSGKSSGKPHGGYYTQEQIKDIVAYAAERNITIVPEFDVPGHSSAAIAAYPWLGTVGKKIEVPVIFETFDVYDVTKPEVKKFVKDVLLELFELFPSPYIHIGGDEVNYKFWNESPTVQSYMKQHNIKTPADLQISFTNNISNFIEQNGRRMMGWNEIMGVNIHKDVAAKKDDKNAETSLAKNVVVHFWYGSLDLAIRAAKEGYGIVNSLNRLTYLNKDYEAITLESAYNFEPIPDGLEAKYHKNIYGSGCQLWSEWTPTFKEVEYQIFPRISAFAEVGWTATKNKDFKSFQKSLKKIQQRWDLLGINYAKIVE